MIPQPHASGSNREAQSPALPDFTPAFLNVNDVHFPTPTEICSCDVLDDWLVKAEDSLTEARNGVTAIAWPLALAGLVGVLAMVADAVGGATSPWAALTSNPFKLGLIIFLFAATVVAFRLASSSSDERRRLTAIRHAYLRRRREL